MNQMVRRAGRLAGPVKRLEQMGQKQRLEVCGGGVCQPKDPPRAALSLLYVWKTSNGVSDKGLRVSPRFDPLHHVPDAIKGFDHLGTQSHQVPMLDAAVGEGINNTDADLFEYQGHAYIYYITGDRRPGGPGDWRCMPAP
ncbi:MAG: hypothetical protein Ct9H300mP1_28600 [Planctomycetaceae bacterium]|nr:MAG: hypothetical protein Ct9H300mP1_28600 [Planctomycetaceae bacterium]